MPAKKAKARRYATYINLRLSSPADDDLIELWRSLPVGKGGQAIKDAIRAGVAAGELPARTARVSDLDTLATWLDGKITASAARLEERIAALERRIATGELQTSPMPASQGEAGNGARRLSAEETAALTAKIAGRKW